MSFTYDLLEPTKDVNQSLDQLTREFVTLYAESWSKEKQENYHKPFNPNMNALAQMWLAGTLRVFIAKDETGKAVGYTVGLVFRPLPYDASVFQIEDWYSQSKEAETGLFAYVAQAIKFIGCSELWVTDKIDREAPLLENWEPAVSFRIQRFVKKV